MLQNYDIHRPLPSRILDNLMTMDKLFLAEGFGFLTYLGHGHSIESMFSLSTHIDISFFDYRCVGNQGN